MPTVGVYHRLSVRYNVPIVFATVVEFSQNEG
jgi:hypothetical protein